MPRLTQLETKTATGHLQTLFDGTQAKLGMVPNMMRAMGNSPAALEAYLQFNGSLQHGKLTAKQREQIALAISEANDCEYCVSAHSLLGKMAGLSADQIRDSRLGGAVDSKTGALLHFALRANETRGRVSEADLSKVREAGFDDGAIAEAIAHVALNVYTNYFNNAAETDLDFPKAAALHPQEASV